MENLITLQEVVYRFIVDTKEIRKVVFMKSIENEVPVPDQIWEYHILPFWGPQEMLVEVMFSAPPTPVALERVRECLYNAYDLARPLQESEEP